VLRDSQRVPIDEQLMIVHCRGAESERKPATANDGSFTLKEYRIHRALLDSSLPENQQLYSLISRQYGVPADQVAPITEKITLEFVNNDWFGRPPVEIRHAKDWKGERE
jgi:hypothetical protein